MSYPQPAEMGNLPPPADIVEEAASRAGSCLDQAEVCIHTGLYSEAARALLMADREMICLSSAEREARLLTARAFYLQGLIYFSRQMPAEAHTEFLLAREQLAGREEGRQLLVAVLSRLGNTHHLDGQMDKAIIYYREAGANAILSGNQLVAIVAYNNIGNIYLSQGKVDEAVNFYHQGLEQAHLSGDALALARSYRALAWLHSNYGPFPLALEYAQRAVAQCEQVASGETRWLIEGELARVFARAGQLERAAQLLTEAFTFIHLRENRIAEAMVAVNAIELWEAYWQRDAGFRPEAEAVVKALEGALRSPLLKSEATRGLASYAVHSADLERAQHYLALTRQALAPADSTNPDDQAIYTHTLARLLAAVGEESQAASFYQEAIRLQSEGHLSRYQLAVVWRDYQALCSRSGPGSDPEIAAQAGAQVQLLCAELGLETGFWLAA